MTAPTYTTLEDQTDWLRQAEVDLAAGGMATDESSAMEMALIRRRVGGCLPCEYPRIGGGCFVAHKTEDGIVIETILNVTPGLAL